MFSGTRDYRQAFAEIRRKHQSHGINHDNLQKAMRDVLGLQREEHREARSKRLTEFSFEKRSKSTGGGGFNLKHVHKAVPQSALEYEFQLAADGCYMAHAVLKASNQGGLRRDSKAYKHLQKLARMVRKALETGTASAGGDFVPTGFSRSLLELVRLDLMVAGLHDRINMPTNPYPLPLEGADANAYLVAESTNDDTTGASATKFPAATAGTAKITLTAKKFGVRSVWSDEVDQDSIIPIQEFARKKLARAMADAQEEATLNGDITGTHQDSDVTAATDRRKAWSGYRKLTESGAKVDASNADPSLIKMRNVRMNMGKYGVNPKNLAWVSGIIGWNKLLNIPEIQTVDKYGQFAVVLTGELGRIDGIPVMISEFVREDLNASGVFDDTTEDRTVMHLVNRNGWLYGDRAGITLKTAEVIDTDQMIMVVKQRTIFSRAQASGQKTLGMLYNLSTAATAE